MSPASRRRRVTRTAYDNDHPALRRVHNEWTGEDADIGTRIDYLRNGGGLNGNTVLNGQTVFDDPDSDRMTGGRDTDRFFADFLDTLLDRKLGERVD